MTKAGVLHVRDPEGHTILTGPQEAVADTDTQGTGRSQRHSRSCV
jgi:hypothetical protein